MLTSSQPPTAPRPLRFAVLCDAPRLTRWQAAVLAELDRSGLAQPALLIVNTTPPAAGASNTGGKFQNFARGSISLWSVYNHY